MGQRSVHVLLTPAVRSFIEGEVPTVVYLQAPVTLVLNTSTLLFLARQPEQHGFGAYCEYCRHCRRWKVNYQRWYKYLVPTLVLRTGARQTPVLVLYPLAGLYSHDLDFVRAPNFRILASVRLQSDDQRVIRAGTPL